jgi:hypothetical protein
MRNKRAWEKEMRKKCKDIRDPKYVTSKVN